MNLFTLGLLQKNLSGNKGDIKSKNGESSYTITDAVDFPVLGLNLYGKSVQDGTPTPEAPVDIVSVGDNGFDIVSQGNKDFNLLSVRDNGGNIITKQPCSMAAKIGDTIKITVVASGEGLTYQWQFIIPTATEWKKSNSAGNNTNTLRPTIDDGWNNAKVRCIVTDSNGNSEISNESTVYVVSDDCEIKTANIVTDALPLCGISVSSGGNYTDSNGQQWLCDELIYNADGTGNIIKNTAKIESYNSEAITTPFISTTGSLTTGATVIYQTDAQQEIPLTAADVSALMQLKTYNGVTNISNSDNAEMDVKYCTNQVMADYYPIFAGQGADVQPLVLFEGTDEGYSLADGFTGFSVYYTDTLPTEEERITISKICADDQTTESRYGYLISKIKSIDNSDYNYTDSAVISSNEMVDLTNYKTLCIDFYGLASYNTTAGDEKDNISNSAYFKIDRPDTLPQSHISYDWTGWDNMGMYYRNHNKYYFDVSQISGEHYLCFGIFHGNYSKYYLNGIKIYKITLM